MTINCVCSDSWRKYCAYRITFASSNAASTSSRITNGADLTFNIAKSKAMALSARSPPLSKDKCCSFLPGVARQFLRLLRGSRRPLSVTLPHRRQTVI